MGRKKKKKGGHSHHNEKEKGGGGKKKAVENAKKNARRGLESTDERELREGGSNGEEIILISWGGSKGEILYRLKERRRGKKRGYCYLRRNTKLESRFNKVRRIRQK